MRPRTLVIALCTFWLCAACAGERDTGEAPLPGEADADARLPAEVAPLPETEPPSDATNDDAPPAPGSWVVTFTGAGPLELGMSAEAAAAALGRDSLVVAPPDPQCGYVLPPQTPDGIAAMVVHGRVVRIDVMENVAPTEAGARVGDSEERIRSLYDGRVEEAPHKYVEGSYLIVSPPAGGDERRIIFETEGETVTAFRTGLLPQVRWVEGCS